VIVFVVTAILTCPAAVHSLIRAPVADKCEWTKQMKHIVLALGLLGISAIAAQAQSTTAEKVQSGVNQAGEVMKQTGAKADAKIKQVVEQLPAGPGKFSETDKGKILTTANGHALYVFDKDSAGKSNCDAGCLKNWPAYHAAAKIKAVAPWSKVKATDGKEMWAYNGKPVYRFIKDTKTGAVMGDGVGGIWHVIKQ
jgi:predicted lipoprotein with Yx(FWY)xxD motif